MDELRSQEFEQLWQAVMRKDLPSKKSDLTAAAPISKLLSSNLTTISVASLLNRPDAIDGPAPATSNSTLATNSMKDLYFTTSGQSIAAPLTFMCVSTATPSLNDLSMAMVEVPNLPSGVDYAGSSGQKEPQKLSTISSDVNTNPGFSSESDDSDLRIAFQEKTNSISLSEHFNTNVSNSLQSVIPNTPLHLVVPKKTLISIPPEIRAIILGLVVGSDEIIEWRIRLESYTNEVRTTLFQQDHRLSIAATCKVLYNEASRLYFESCTFKFRECNSMRQFLDNIGERRRLIRKIRLHYLGSNWPRIQAFASMLRCLGLRELHLVVSRATLYDSDNPRDLKYAGGMRTLLKMRGLTKTTITEAMMNDKLCFTESYLRYMEGFINEKVCRPRSRADI